jgi:hypothetical protein
MAALHAAAVAGAGAEPVAAAARLPLVLAWRRRASPDTLARLWRAQRRLHARYKALTARGKPPGMALTAVARELADFVWAEMTS